MNTEVHHDSTSAPAGKAGTIVTLGDMREAIDASDTIPADRKRHFSWALNRTIALVGQTTTKKTPSETPFFERRGGSSSSDLAEPP